MVDAVASVVKRLGDLLVENIVFLQGVPDEVQSLTKRLEWMQSFLKDAEQRQDQDYRIQKWIFDVINAAYDAEDIIDDFILKVEEGGGGTTKKIGFRASFQKYLCVCNKEAYVYKQANLYGIGKDIVALKKTLDEIQQNQEAFNIRNVGDAREGPRRLNDRLQQRRRERPYEDDEHVVGFREDVDLLISQLHKEIPHRCVIAIVGMGGLGKTTMARKLYNTRTHGKKFDCYAWVSVSKEYDIKDLLQRMIKSFEIPTTKEEWEMLEGEEDLERYLRKYLDTRRYLVVIDDVWDTDAWASLKNALPDKGNRSRVIMTTRIEAVADSFGERIHKHKLPFLEEDDSWELFCNKAFANYDGDDDKTSRCPLGLEELARDMVRKCRGLPLAIVVLGGILLRKPRDDWPKVREDVLRHVSDDGSAHVSQILALSFNDLPYHLKPCFLYLGLFPEDFEIEVEKLLRLWVAEGFIQPSKEALEEVATKSLNELLDRNLIQIAHRTWRRIAACRVHDLLRDLAIEKSKELNFLHIYDGKSYSALSPNSRRLASQSGFGRFVSFDNSNLRLRTLLFFTLEYESAEMAHLEILFAKLRLLRVLDLEGISFEHSQTTRKRRLPDAIGKLIHLRYLGLVRTEIDELPPSIGNLRALQTLDVGFADSLMTLPDEICNAKQLRHLIGRFKWPFRVNNLKDLQTLNFVEVDGPMEFNPMEELINLRELYVTFTGKGSGFNLDSIGRLQSLQTLHLKVKRASNCFPSLQPLSHCRHLFQLKLWGNIQELPTEMHEFLPNLKYLGLDGTKIRNDPMPILEKLPKLTFLDLYGYKGNKLACTAGGFPQLEILQLTECDDLKELHVDEGGMLQLKGLEVPGNATIPERLRSIPALKIWVIQSRAYWPY